MIAELLPHLSAGAARCDVGYWVRYYSGKVMTNDYRREATEAEKHGALMRRLTERNPYGRPLAEQFPHDFATIKNALP